MCLFLVKGVVTIVLKVLLGVFHLLDYLKVYSHIPMV
jgi:hypothetical protein